MTKKLARIRIHLASERGWALLTALVMLSLMAAIGLAALAYVDTQTAASRQERTRDSAYNLAEGVLAEQAYLLVNYPPASSGFAYPDCTWSTGQAAAVRTGGMAASACISPSSLNATFSSNPDYAASVTWTTRVRDNWGSQTCQEGGGSNCSYFYDKSSAGAQPYPSCTSGCFSWDSNGDNEVWVVAQASVRGKKHTLVELVRVDKHPIGIPNSVLIAGYVDFQNKHTSVAANGSAVDMRCNSSQGSNCVESSHIEPSGSIVYGYPGQNVLQTPDITALVARAKQENAYYDSCPTDPPGTLVVVLATSSSQCGWSSLPVTSPSKFGTYIQLNGQLRLNGTNSYYGLIYLGNSSVPGFGVGSPRSDDVYYDNGNATIQGSLMVDGPGGAHIGNGAQSAMSFDSRAFTNLWSYGNQNIVKGSFREIDG